MSDKIEDNNYVDITKTAWFDSEKVEQACQVYKKNLFSVHISCLTGLLCLFAVPSIASTLDFTEQTSSPIKAFKRYYKTVMIMSTWYDFSMWKNEEASKSLSKLRRIHDAVARKQSKTLDCPVNARKSFSQIDLAITQFAFVGPMLLLPSKLGICITRQESESLIHLWRCIGFALGIEDQYNICHGTYEQAIKKCKLMLNFNIIPALIHPSPEFTKLSVNLIKGLKLVIPFLNYDAFLKFVFQLFDLTYPKKLKNYSLFIYWVQKCICEIFLFFSLVRLYFNYQLLVALKRSYVRYIKTVNLINK